ncbi:MAG: tetratricopeptide repeat protein [Deltaproteobacteria bacterium]|nr:tetratricopeptide repeat protein [Deltaproteobacteria bacterium]
METRPETPAADQDQSIAYNRQDRQLFAEPAPQPGAARITSLDLLQYEAVFCASLRKFLSFKTYTLHFPAGNAGENPEPDAEILPHERKILLPLTEPGGSLLGIFVAKDAQLAGVKKILPYLRKIGELCLENLILYKQSLCDQVSGLFTRQRLLSVFAGNLEHMREYLRPENPSRGPVRVSLLVLRLNGLAALAHEHGYVRAERFLACLALELELLKPPQTVAARSGDDEFALLLPSLSAGECHALGQKLVNGLNGLRMENEFSGQVMRVNVSAGYATFPTDLNGIDRHPPDEQAGRLLRRAELAAALAHENTLATRHIAVQTDAPEPVLAYGKILAEGGRVLQLLPLSRMRLNLGKSVGARPGQRFALWGYVLKSADPESSSLDGAKRGPQNNGLAAQIIRRYKGEVLLVEARQNDSTAELVYCDDPHFPPEAGDQLLITASNADFTGQDAPAILNRAARLDEATGFLSYPDFLTRWCVERKKYADFALLLTRFGLPKRNFLLELDEVEAGEAPPPHGLYIPWEEQISACADLYRSTLDALSGNCLYGRYGLNSFIIFIPGTTAAVLFEQAKALSARSLADTRIALQSALGIAPHPFLDFRKGDALENAGKALEYALLLPAPHVGLLDSLALNISADRRYSMGDQPGAISEYKRALLCDENNILAWNSLGVTLAGLGRRDEARRHFEEALKRNAQNAAALYNLGQLSESGGDHEGALRFFLRCRELSPANVYVLYRLGQLAERGGNNSRAADYYKQAARLPGGEAITKRALARLAIKENRLEEARAELHEALLLNPNDAAALQLLARLYLDAGENPLVAESLTRQSVALRPDFKAAWLELARALEASGKAHEAREAVIKAGEL